jgi:hypothetical protein
LSNVLNKSAGSSSKKVKLFALALMVYDRAIPADQLHRPYLPLAGIQKQAAVFLVAVLVAILVARFTGKEKNNRKSRWRANPALALASVLLV